MSLINRRQFVRRGGANRRLAWLCVLIVALLLRTIPVSAQDAYTPYAWTDADLALIYPASWNAPVAKTGDDGSPTLALASSDTTIALTVLPDTITEGAIRPTLETLVSTLNQLPLHYDLETMYGRGGLHIDTVSADRQQIGIARAGRLPDNRTLLIASRAPQVDQPVLEQELGDILDSIVFSASLPPTIPTYRPLWSAPLVAHRINGLTVSKDRLYTVDSDNGVQIWDAASGAAVSTIPFDHPAAPTGIGVDESGIVYVADTVCRCIRKLNPEGKWFDSVGSFGGGAPFSLAVALDGTLYATDVTDSGYALRILAEPHDRAVPLSFNASAPPLVALDSSGGIWVTEWLSSLLDNTISVAVSQVDRSDKPTAQLQFWLQGFTPQTVTAFSGTGDGALLFATNDRGILFVDPHGTVVNTVDDRLAASIVLARDGTLYATDVSGDSDSPQTILRAFSAQGTPDRYGSQMLAIGVPVVGLVSETSPQQTWTFDGTTGQQITLASVDQSLTDPAELGLDTALHLLAPDGTEIAHNDDQQGTDLFGVYDAEIPDFVLPQTGTYSVNVEWRQGQGMYTLGLSENQPLALNSDGVTEIKGQLQDVFPVQRWSFAGHRGDVLTFTMSADGGTLDPALALFRPDGKLVAYNDDASDPDLKDNAQLSQVRLSDDGTYILEASRYEGVGSYTITIVNTG